MSQEDQYVDEIQRLEISNQELTRHHNEQVQQNVALQQAVYARQKTVRTESSHQDYGIEVLRAFVQNKPFTPTQCLEFIQVLGGSRVEVLPEAYKSAEFSDPHFQYGDRLLKLLCKLVTNYYETLQKYGEDQASQIFTSNEYAMQESETVKNSKNVEIWGDRSVWYNGAVKKMVQHLKIGVKNNIAYCLRVYFFYDRKKEKIIIGYCGPHPKLIKS